MFQITTAQLTKAVTGVDYESGPHPYTKKCKTSATKTSSKETAPHVEPSTSTTAPTPKSPAEPPTSATALKATREEKDALSSSSSDLPSPTSATALKATQEEKDTLSSSSSDLPPF